MTLAWGAKLSPTERAGLLEVAAELGCDPSHLSACIEFESRWNPAAVNATTGATGLIQFMPRTAAALGTTVEALRGMTRLQQLDYVLAYLRPYAGRLRTLSDCYMAILWPRAVGQPEDYVVFADGSAAYAANAALDVDRNCAVTKAEAAAFPARRLAEGLLPGNAAPTAQDVAGGAQAAATPPPSPAPNETPSGPPVQPAAPSRKETTMPLMALLSAFGPILANLIPQIGKIVNPQGEVAQRNLQLAQVAVDTITQAANASNLQEAVEKMQASPEVVQTVTQAVVTAPQIMQALTLPTDAAKAVERSVVIQNAERPFWYNPLVWVTAALLPMMYMLTAAVLFLSNAGLAKDGTIVPDAAWYAVLGFDPSTRSGLVNLIVGFVFGGVTGVWFGTSASSQRNSNSVPVTK